MVAYSKYLWLLVFFIAVRVSGTVAADSDCPGPGCPYSRIVPGLECSVLSDGTSVCKRIFERVPTENVYLCVTALGACATLKQELGSDCMCPAPVGGIHGKVIQNQSSPETLP